MICFLCKGEGFSLNSLVVHFRIFHSLHRNSTYECCENYCNQSFSSLRSFKRHVTKKHQSSNKDDNDISYNSSQELNSNGITTESTETITEEIKNGKLEEDQLVYDYEKTKAAILKSIASFLVYLHNFNNLSRKDVEKIQLNIQEKIMKPILNCFNVLVKYYIEDFSIKTIFSKFSETIEDAFKLCSTNYRFEKWLSENNLISNIMQFTINNEVRLISHCGEATYNDFSTKGCLLPLKFQFKQIFEKENLLEKYLNKPVPENSSSNNISTFTDGLLWKEKISLSENKICIPYFLYVDDFEINNPLGYHQQPMTAIYYSFPIMENTSKLQNIFLAGFIKALDFKMYGNDACLRYLIDTVNNLAKEGVVINTSNGFKTVYFYLAIVLGDNLGLNSILNFSKSFSSKFFCRLCKCDKKMTQSLDEESEEYLRTIDSYNNDILYKTQEETGIVGNSILNEIHLYHVVKNFSLDIMHDIFEGICHYNLCHIIKYYTENVKIFSLITLNERKKCFNYGEIESGNISGEIRPIDLNKFRLKMSASEMKCFVYFFPLIIGDLIPPNDEVWEFLKCFLKIIEMLLSNTFGTDSLQLLKLLIKEHNSKYIVLFKDTLKPKHHNLTHYPTVISNSGPPRYFWSFRFEAKHKEFKTYARSITSRKNISFSLAKKYQMKFAHLLVCNKQTNLETSVKHLIKSKYIKLVNEKLKGINKKESYSQICYDGTIYKTKYYLTRFRHSLELFLIKEIIVAEDVDVFFILDEILINGYDSHYLAYEVDKGKTIISEELILNIKEFQRPPFNINETLNGKLMFRLKENF